METFEADSSVGKVLAFVGGKIGRGEGEVQVMTTFPRRVYSHSDASLSVRDAGWMPSSVLMVCK